MKIYDLPHGRLYINDSQTITECVLLGNDKIVLTPGKSKFTGAVTPGDYFASPHLWEIQRSARSVIEKKGSVIFLVDCSRMDRLGDQVVLTIVPKAIKQSYGDSKTTVKVLIPEKFFAIWENNPYADEIVFSTPVVHDIVIDMNRTNLRCERKDFEKNHTSLRNRTTLYLEQAGLYVVNKTPVLMPSESQLTMAAEIHQQHVDRKLVGVAMHSQSQSREYPHMQSVCDRLVRAGYDVMILDEKDEHGEFVLDINALIVHVLACDVVVAADSAILHIAGALKKRIAGLFGHTEGKVTCDSYEKALWAQGTCPMGSLACWWTLSCLPGVTYQEKENLAKVDCMRSISVDSVMDAVERQLRSPKKILATMLTFNLLSWTKVAIDSLRSFHDLDLFVIDNESTDGTQQWLTEQGIEFISKRSSVPEAENYGVKKFLAGDYDYFLLLNNDICLRHDAIDKLVEHIEQEGGNSAITGITSWVVEETPFYSVDDAAPRDRQIETIVDLPHSAFSCTLFSRKAIEEVGQFDERFGPRYIEDNDYILRLRLAGGKFLRVHDSLYYHVLGGVVKTDEDEKKGYDANWNKNCNAFTAKWGITPHEHQMLSKVQAVPECKTLMDRIAWESSRRVFRLGIKRWMGGAGDHIFLSAIARHVRKLAPNCHIIYIVPHQFKDVYDCCPYIDVATSDEAVKTDLTIDCTDLDYKVEKYEMAKYGHIISPRSKIYLDYLGIKTDDIKLDFFVSDAEKRWGEGQWLPRSRGLVRVVVASKASNMMMTWPHTDAFVTLLEKAGKYDIKIADAQSNGRYLLSFRQACSVLATADAYVGPNSSFSNVAGAMGIPAITLFSSRNGENMARMYSSMIPVQGDCSVKEGSHYCDYATPCILPEKEYRERENTKHPDCIASIAPERVQTILEETIT